MHYAYIHFDNGDMDNTIDLERPCSVGMRIASEMNSVSPDFVILTKSRIGLPDYLKIQAYMEEVLRITRIPSTH